MAALASILQKIFTYKEGEDIFLGNNISLNWAIDVDLPLNVIGTDSLELVQALYSNSYLLF